MKQDYRKLAVLLAICFFSTLLLWLPFGGGLNSFLGFRIPAGGMQTIFANYDGPNYIIIAKTWYQKSLIAQNFSFPLPLEYYPAHLPGYPALIFAFSLFLSPVWSMLFSTLLTSLLMVAGFYLLITKFKLSTDPFWLGLVFIFLPARIFIVRSIGAPETLFISAILFSFYFFKSQRFWLAGLCGAVAQLTKTPAILLFAAYLIYLLGKQLKNREKISSLLKKVLPLFLIPAAAAAVFIFYYYQTGDLLAYFHSGDNFHLTLFPYQSFNSSRSWLGGIWNEDLIWLYLLAGSGILLLFKRRLTDLGIFTAVFYLATLLVAHRDLSRYSLPMWPLLLIGFDPLLQKKEFKIAFFLILPAIYLYALNFIIGNTAPVADWSPYL